MFAEVANFSGATFTKTAKFKGAIFTVAEEPIGYIEDVTFANFGRAIFSQAADFYRATFTAALALDLPSRFKGGTHAGRKIPFALMGSTPRSRPEAKMERPAPSMRGFPPPLTATLHRGGKSCYFAHNNKREDTALRRRAFLGTVAAIAALPRFAVGQQASVLRVIPHANLSVLDPIFTTALIQ
jgi:hypothetical protein